MLTVVFDCLEWAYQRTQHTCEYVGLRSLLLENRNTFRSTIVPEYCNEISYYSNLGSKIRL